MRGCGRQLFHKMKYYSHCIHIASVLQTQKTEYEQITMIELIPSLSISELVIFPQPSDIGSSNQTSGGFTSGGFLHRQLFQQKAKGPSFI